LVPWRPRELKVRAATPQASTTRSCGSRPGGRVRPFLGPDGSGEVSANRTLLLLLDLNLPDMSGVSILQRLKTNEHTRRMPVTTDDRREI